MSAERTGPWGTVLDLGDCEVDPEILLDGGRGAVLGTNVTLREKRTDDFAIVEADSPEQLERLAAVLSVAAQKLREAREAAAVRIAKVGIA